MERERVDVSAEIAGIAKTGFLGIQKERPRFRVGGSMIERVVYVPDDAHIDICLNCTRKKCTGNCKLMSKVTRKKS